MNFDLSEEHELLRDTVRQFALEKVAPVAEELDREKKFPYETDLREALRRWRDAPPVGEFV